MLIPFGISEIMEFRTCALGGCPEYTKLCVSERLIPYHLALIRKLKKNRLMWMPVAFWRCRIYCQVLKLCWCDVRLFFFPTCFVACEKTSLSVVVCKWRWVFLHGLDHTANGSRVQVAKSNKLKKPLSIHLSHRLQFVLPHVLRMLCALWIRLKVSVWSHSFNSFLPWLWSGRMCSCYYAAVLVVS